MGKRQSESQTLSPIPAILAKSYAFVRGICVWYLYVLFSNKLISVRNLVFFWLPVYKAEKKLWDLLYFIKNFKQILKFPVMKTPDVVCLLILCCSVALLYGFYLCHPIVFDFKN